MTRTTPLMDRDGFLRPFVAAGFVAREPALLFPADLFIDLSGEELSKRLFMTNDGEGNDLCLRPELTIPICIEHLAEGDANRRADYAYFGRAFRHRNDGPSEFWQGGIEAIGETNRADADARCLALAMECARRHGVSTPHLRLGDAGLFRAVIEAVALPASWRRKLARDFGRSSLSGVDLTALALGKPSAAGRAGLIAALDRADHEGARALVADLLALGGLHPVGGRGVDEIAERFLERAESAAIGAEPEHLALLQAFLAIEAPPCEALFQARSLLASLGANVAQALDELQQCADACRRAGVAIDDAVFSASFGRRLDYYSGLVFELYHKPDRREPPLIGGGRYDRLLTLLGAQMEVPAIGFSLWVERLGEEG